MKTQKVSYRGWQNALRLANSRVEVIVTLDVGPRVIFLSTPGGENIFANFEEQMGLTGGDEWRIYGGHRLWHSPEAKPRSYYPDNAPVDAQIEGDTVRLIPPAETPYGIQKEIDITLLGDEPHLEVRHILENTGPWPIEVAPWAISVMNVGGVAIIPQPSWSTPGDLLANRMVALWPYSDMADPRVHWGSRYIMLRQDPGREPPFKFGLNAADGWAAYARSNMLFVKTFEYEPDAVYPDYGCSAESYVCGRFLELETVAPLTWLEPGETVEHTENWFLFSEVGPVATEQDADQLVLPLAQQALDQSAF